MVAGAAQSPICCPVELVRIRMETDNLKAKPQYTGTLNCYCQTIKRHGVRELFRGFNSTLLRETFSFGCYFASYEWLTLQMKRLKHMDRTDELGIPFILLAGGTAGMLTWLSTYPVDVVKTCYQEQVGARQNSAWLIARQLLKEHGWRVFFRGVTPCLARAFPANAATFAAYEATKRMMREFDE